MNVSQKCQYALRALFELAKRLGEGLVPNGEIAAAQAIPPRFLELILGQLRQAGYIESRRGVHGGYMLAVRPEELSVGEVIRLIDGPTAPVKCIAGNGGGDCPLHGRCVFLGLWERANEAVSEVYDSTSFRDLLERERQAAGQRVPDYCI